MNKRWYIVHAYTNFENNVREAILAEAEIRGLTEHFEEVLVPKETVTEVKRGKRVDTEKTSFPGYVLVKVALTNEVHHLIKNTPKVTGFLGTAQKPQPIPEREAERILNQATQEVDRPRPQITFEVGEQVRVADGPFASFNGLVEEVDDERARVKVAVSIFGRPTNVELEYAQVEKVAG